MCRGAEYRFDLDNQRTIGARHIDLPTGILARKEVYIMGDENIALLKCKCRDDDRDVWRVVAVCESLGTAEQLALALNAISPIEVWKATESNRMYDELVDTIYFG